MLDVDSFGALPAESAAGATSPSAAVRRPRGRPPRPRRRRSPDQPAAARAARLERDQLRARLACRRRRHRLPAGGSAAAARPCCRRPRRKRCDRRGRRLAARAPRGGGARSGRPGDARVAAGLADALLASAPRTRTGILDGAQLDRERREAHRQAPASQLRPVSPPIGSRQSRARFAGEPNLRATPTGPFSLPLRLRRRVSSKHRARHRREPRSPRTRTAARATPGAHPERRVGCCRSSRSWKRPHSRCERARQRSNAARTARRLRTRRGRAREWPRRRPGRPPTNRARRRRPRPALSGRTDAPTRSHEPDSAPPSLQADRDAPARRWRSAEPGGVPASSSHELAWLVNEALVEQARRHGVDLS